MLSDTCLQISQSSENNKFGKEATGKLLWQYVILRIRAMKKTPLQEENEGAWSLSILLFKKCNI